MIARFAYFPERDDIFDIETLSFKDSEAVITKGDVRLCVPGPSLELFRSTDFVDRKNELIYEMDVVQILLTWQASQLLGYTTVRYSNELGGFTVDDFIGVFPEDGEPYLTREQFVQVFEFTSLASLISSPCAVTRIGNFYEVEKSKNPTNMRAMFCINKLKKDLARHENKF